jgi:hypothetical protein
MLLLVICVPKVLSSFKSGSFMSKEARAGCLLVVTRGVPYCAGNIWKDIITTSLTGGACSLRWISWNFCFPTVGFSTMVVVFSVSRLVYSCQFLCHFVYWIEDIWSWIFFGKRFRSFAYTVCQTFFLPGSGWKQFVGSVGHSSHNMLRVQMTILWEPCFQEDISVPWGV